MKHKIIVGNWKMNGDIQSNETLLLAIKKELVNLNDRTIVICPPYTYFYQVRDILNNTSIKWGAQNISRHERGARTGSISPIMVKEFGCSYVILGHSERRLFYKEKDSHASAKFISALNADITPIYCVGESLDEYSRGSTARIVMHQLDSLIKDVGSNIFKGMLAYEPTWAIGTNKTATPEHANKVAKLMKQYVKSKTNTEKDMPILYGGSVNSKNCQSLISEPNIDGFLIGGASLIADEFVAIAKC